ncbi:NAD dependent epimerase/dehydratase family protein [Hyaloraphidium curvatum]|nr:NAD dependent epimerase/dehydratase family protein [Hyaloraphidium curvatum]
MASSVFITGGSGFVGRNLFPHLRRAGATDLVALVRTDEAEKKALAAGATRVVRGDLSDVGVLADGMKGCDAVYHCAASLGREDPKTMEEINVRGTANVVEAAKRAGVRVLLHVGTEAGLVKGLGHPLVGVDESFPIPDTWAGPYSETKAKAERIALQGNGDGLKVVVVRPRFIWGNDDSSILPIFVGMAKSGQLKWFDGGNNRISHCHVDNCCHGMVLAATKGPAGGVYFLTDGEDDPFRAFMTRMLAAAGVEAPPESESVPLPAEGNQLLALMAQEVTVSDARARKELGYANVVSVEQGMADLARRHGVKM